jgi:capsular polysaccharide biosynthesis protein
MVETVPKVRYLREFEQQTGSAVTVLVPPSGPPFIDETLELLGWPASRVVRATDQMYRAQNLIVPSFPQRTPADFEWIQGEILDAVSTERESVEREGRRSNVYVSRANAVERRVTNEREVIDVLSDYGFERYYLENRSLVENVRLFNRAEVVVGPHGAGLTDIIFAENCTLIELFGEKVKEPYELLAGAVGADYEPVYCRADSADIVVDVEKLEAKVAEVVE